VETKLKIKPIYECRCNERLPTKRFTRLAHTGLVVELQYLKIKTRLTNEKFASVKGECSNTFYVYYESIKREPKIRGIYECRCDERLQTKTKSLL
jgi:hypothetical protein